ncbi:winged helix-turn-helix domain-containing protein [Dokdonella sp.]|uniref:winged helix-turn-helix domain-containing protein n=1 Tax=Dokdonella sp. TaxID=2291710 RepID=UPI001B15E759|nr:winged helix-turn-helix domain-containing protein [Dokdonella sp.]MBO9663895.1 winged helix-turn-helix domain-containing protein [Dokdonella sp.]
MIRRLYHFGDCIVDVAARELRQAGKRVPLSPTVFDCIAYLLEHRDRAVGRDELVSAVWGKASVTDSLVGKTLVKARRAVGDDGAQQAVILTVPRFGFHWIAPVRVEEVAADVVVTAPISALPVEVAAPSEPPVSEPVARGARGRRWMPFGIAVALACCAALGALLYAMHSRAPTQVVAAKDGLRLAVVPVEIEGRAEDGWLRLGLMDLIAQRLRAGGLGVVASDVVVRVVGDAPVEVAARSLRDAAGASALVAASARRHGSEWIVRAVLRDADGREREVEARANDAVTVGRAAADRLLRLLGRDAPDERAVVDLPLAEVSQRVDAALLVNDFDAARRAIASASADDQSTPELQLRLSEIDYRLGLSDAARERLEHLLPALPRETEPALRARALTGLGAIALKQNRAAPALPSLDEAIALLDRLNEPESLGHALTARGIAHAMRAEYAEAGRDFARARIAFELSGDAHAAARVDINEGAVATMRDRPADALPLYERAADRFERLDAPTDLINTLGNEVDARLALLQPAAALAASERMMPLMERIRNPLERRVFLVIRARALAAVGRIAEARALLADLLQSADAEREPTVLGEARAQQAALDLAAGQGATAAALSRQAIAALDGAEFAHARAEAWRVLVLSLLRRSEAAAAAEEGARFTQWAVAARRASVLALARLAQAELVAAQGGGAAVEGAFDEARRAAEQAGVPRDIATVAIANAQALIAAGELPRAAEAAGQLARWSDRDFDCALLQVHLYHALGQREAWNTSLVRARGLAGERRIANELQREPGTPAPIGRAEPVVSVH